MQNNNKKFKARKGFTLVELVVVLVIIGILLTITIPTLTAWIDKAKLKHLASSCRSCVTATQTLILEQYAIDQNRAIPLTADIKTLAGVKGTPSGIRLMDSSAQVHYMTYQEGGDSVTYDADACTTGECYFFGAGAGTGTGATPEQMQENMQTIINTKKSKANVSMDSTAAAVYSKSYATKFEAALKDAGLNLSDLGANTWRIDSNNIFYWSDRDINAYKVGDTMLVMRYNSKTDCCNLWEATVLQQPHPDDASQVYKVLKPANNGVKEYKDMTPEAYSTMLTDFKTMSEESKYQPST